MCPIILAFHIEISHSLHTARSLLALPLVEDGKEMVAGGPPIQGDDEVEELFAQLPTEEEPQGAILYILRARRSSSAIAMKREFDNDFSFSARKTEEEGKEKEGHGAHARSREIIVTAT